MVRLLSSILVAVSAHVISVSAVPVEVVGRQACSWTCGTACYDDNQVDAALSQGYSLFQSGSDYDNYPHQYNNYEGFDFPTPGPWQEYPILSSGDVYDGGSPGADRVIFNEDGAFNMLITHTGASGNAFVACTQG